MVAPGDTVKATANITNLTSSVLRNLVLFADAPNAVIQAAEGVTTDGGTAYIAEIAAGGSVQVVYTYAVSAESGYGASIVNNCFVYTASGFTDIASKIHAVTAFLSAALTADKTNAIPGEAVTFTATVKNMGETPLPMVKVYDSLGNSLPWNYGNGVVSDMTGAAIIPGPIISSLRAGETITFTYAYTVPANAQSGDSITNTFTVHDVNGTGNNSASASNILYID
jgi:uncharacterized repeat protein (TIGR01451 family)